MPIVVKDVPQWEWEPLAMRGCHGVTARVILVLIAAALAAWFFLCTDFLTSGD